MNIAEAKQHVKATVQAYLTKDADGLYIIEQGKQRPLFLLGAPGIGKTAIMNQIADELGVGLVSYSMTHHTRQSALGLPFIVHHNYDGFEFEASEYTMSEIVASIYDHINVTGNKRGILFLDEINCVSETLYPSMLQFLQFKTFGRHRIPDDWVVVCAGNPPEYNKSVHEFDIVTMDRLRKLAIEPDYEAWKRYAVDHGMHPSILTFLEGKRECFYHVESTPSGKRFVTARGWDDLSQIISLFEQTEETVDLQLIEQFLQDPEIAESFALYYELFRKYRSDYQVASILAGEASDEIAQRAKDAAFDERLALLGLVLDALSTSSTEVLEQEQVMTAVRDALREVKPKLMEGGEAEELLAKYIDEAQGKLDRLIAGKTAAQGKIRVNRRILELFKKLGGCCVLAGTPAGQEAFLTIQQEFRGHVSALELASKECRAQFENAFVFVENVFGSDREMLVFMTEIAARQSLSGFVSRFGCDGYFRHSEDLKVNDHRSDLFSRIDDLAAATSRAIAESGAAPAGVAGNSSAAHLEPSVESGAADRGELESYYQNACWEYGYASLCHMGLPSNLQGRTILDIGCRRGKGIFKLSDRVGATGRAIGMDWSEEHIKEATQRMDRAWRETGLPANNMEFHLGYPEDLISMGLGNNTVDAVFINSVLHLTADPKRVLSEIHRVLKPGGLLIAEIAFADAHRDEAVVEEARKIGNSIQAAPYKAEFDAYLAELGFGEPEMQEGGPISPATGYKFDFEVATAPSDEEVSFEATVTHYTKLS